MNGRPSFPSLLESFFRHRMAKQRNATPATIASYRDALRMLILFAADRARCGPCDLTIDGLDRDTVLAFFDHLEASRGNKVQTRNARLAAVRSFFQHVAANDPASLGIAHRILAIPLKRAHIEVTHHLTRAELDALIAAPDQRTGRAAAIGPCCCFSVAPAPGYPKRWAQMSAISSSTGPGPRCFCAARDAGNVSCQSPPISRELSEP
jgi:integrase/recombinase XerD